MPTSQESTGNDGSREYLVARLDKNKFGDLAWLYKEIYGVVLTEDYFLKKYGTSYTGIENTGFIAYDQENKPIAYYGVIPCYIIFEDVIILAAQAADAMTDPQYRYKGIYAKLYSMTFDLCRELNIRLIFGFPNQDFYKLVSNKAEWKTTETMDYFTIHISGLSFASFFQRFGFLKKLYRKYFLSQLHSKIISQHGITSSAIADGFAAVYRNAEYLDYKTYNTSNVIKINNSKIWISDKYGLVIGDMEGVNEENFDVVINELKKIANKSGLRQIQFHSSPGTSLHKLFAAKYESKPSFHIIFQDFGSAIPPEKIKFTFADIDIF